VPGVTVRIVRLGDPRDADEGVRIGTVRRPPRGVPKAGQVRYYDTWLPLLAPSAQLLSTVKTVRTDADWDRFATRYRREMAQPDPARVLDLLAALSHTADFSVGCYCADEQRCHRSVLRRLLTDRGALVAPAGGDRDR
jgi:uncharacterized protein YeaO (DUF488 family)